jgi:hypothetical protein
MEMPLIKNIFNDKNNNIIIGLITVFVIIWSLVYAIPNFINSLFHTILGNIILILIVVLISMNNVIYGILSAILIFILYRVTITSNKEGFTWKKESIDKFIGIQQSINPNVIFDVNKIQEQASQEDVDYFIKNGMWPWSKEVIELYKNAVSNNKYIRTNLGDSVLEARKIYNENIILEILSWQEKEGQFLMTGVTVLYENNKDRNGLGTYAYNSELVTDVTNPKASVIKCDTNFEINADTNSKIILKQYQYTGDGVIFGEHNTKITDVDYNNLEKLIPGFKFIKEPCNPCLALNDPSNYSCPFKLDIKDTKEGVSQVWSYLWRTKGNITDPSLKPLDVSSSHYTGTETGDFPILNQLKNELNEIHLFEKVDSNSRFIAYCSNCIN